MPLDIAHGSAWSTALPDWEERLLAGRSLVPELPLFKPVADKALAIFRRLRVPDMIGKPTFGETAEPWVFDFVAALFGCFDPETKKRMIRDFFLLIPKKNTKTTIAAGIMVTALILNERPDAEFLLIAPTQEVAKTAYAQARGMVRADAEIDADHPNGAGGFLKVRDHRKMIEHLVSGAELKILSADTDVVTGTRATGVLVDETHVLGAKPKAPEIFTELRGGLAARPDGFFLQITTQSKEEPRGQFRAELNKARAVRDGRLALPMLAVLYELPEKMARDEAWRDEATWALVNPNLERSVSIDYLRGEWLTAQERGKEAEALFASQHLNVEIGLGLHSERWIGADYWPACADKTLDGLAALMERSEVVVAGIDIGGLDDLSSVGFIGREAETRDWLHWSRSWVVPDALERRREIASKLEDLAEVGDLVIEPDTVAHVEQMAGLIAQVRDAGLLPAVGGIGVDPWGVQTLLDELDQLGFAEDAVFGVGQGFKLSGRIQSTERRLLDGRLRHGDQPIMRWALANAKTEMRGNNVLITKARAGQTKIDPLIALFNAVALMDRNPVAASAMSSPWNDPDYRMAV